MASLYSGVGEVLTHYELDVNGVALVKRAAVTLPENVQYAWPHPSKRYLYIASSNRGPTTGGDKHYLSAFRMDLASALEPHGDPLPLAYRPVHMSLDVKGSYALVAYNNPAGVLCLFSEWDPTAGSTSRGNTTSKPEDERSGGLG